MTTVLKTAKAQRHYSEHPVGTQRTNRYGTELLPPYNRIINTLNYRIMTNNQQEKRPQLNCKITAKCNGTNIELNLSGVTAVTTYIDRDLYIDFICAFIAGMDEVTDRIILAKLWGHCGGDACMFTDLVTQPNYDEDYDFSTVFFEALMQEITYQLNS